jgi:D-alanyl-D-alanine carboxypeptidase (penicillin-binding protein 5/6)
MIVSQIKALRLISYVTALLCALALALPAAAQNVFDTKAGQAVLVDAGTGTMLFSKDADRLIPPASLAKLMTMEVVFAAIKAGEITLDTTFKVSENAWRRGGAPSGTSTMFAELNSSIRVEDLIQGVIIQSANDGCIVLAEGMEGSEEKFAERMTRRARELGLENSVFKNPHGLPAEGQVVTMRELARLAEHLWRSYPEFYRFYAQRDFTWNGIFQRNRNPLLAMEIGADGLKTGFTEASGYAIVGSLEKDGRRLFSAMSGMATDGERATEARKLLEWGLSAFNRVAVYEDGEIVGAARVYGGERGEVALRAQGPIAVMLPATARERVSARIVYQGPVEAPVEEGAPIGVVKVWVGEEVVQETPVFAAESVGVGSLSSRALGAIEELLVGWMR